MITTFTPCTALFGGALIGLSASALLLLLGRIAGISGIAGGLLKSTPGEIAWRLAFISGLLGGGLLLAFVYPAGSDYVIESSLPVLIVAGLLVGFGTRLGGGCTSGHGVCGLGRRSVRSLFVITQRILKFSAMKLVTLREHFLPRLIRPANVFYFAYGANLGMTRFEQYRMNVIPWVRRGCLGMSFGFLCPEDIELPAEWYLVPFIQEYGDEAPL